jgi:uncharacterized membrane protein YoaK (UPF0700 family)
MLPASVLAIIAGYVDAVGYLHFDAFAGLMTGNTIFLGIELATQQYARAAFHSLIIIAFLAGVMLSRILLRLGWKPWLALTGTALLLVVCSFVERSWAAVLLAFAMGMQNSAANRFNGVALNTVFITGNLQKFGEELIAWLWPTDEPQSAGGGVLIFGLVWVSYAVGALLGALTQQFMPLPLLIPAALLPFAMLRVGARRPAP